MGRSTSAGGLAFLATSSVPARAAKPMAKPRPADSKKPMKAVLLLIDTLAVIIPIDPGPDSHRIPPVYGLRGLALPLLAGLILSSCEDEKLIAGASLEVEPEAIEFGKVPRGKTRSVDLVLRSRSPVEVVIHSLAIAEGSAPVFALSDVPDRIAGGAEARVRVTYAPDDAEPDAGHIEIASSAIDGARILVPLSSARTFPRIEVRPGELELGSLLAGGEASGTIEIGSAGDATLEVKRASLRTLGFLGEVCVEDADCREGRCSETEVCCD